ncbi:MAG: DUF120 domain-containing protein [Candidatus Korarchaeota archaeon]|nr:DUF120 domain-containing protein [Candidatus Korarchaeota archaeon]NIU85013.1 DUF120 domain-containing protein [Candidatus Thorarchaeota archaeon]NIW15038.1 DUF120 domain-containing protein [Candidatus Thorarchaeota archaeon]NIW53048.1 DUF120 domain-containing protein [Candidatus Korarchaeota archaeon]
MMVRIRGKVFSGKGEGKHYLKKSEYREFFSELLGGSVYPGTLNLRLAQKWGELKNWSSYKPKSYGKIFYKLGKLHQRDLSIPIVLVRPVLTDYEEKIIEVVARQHLKKELNLHDGDVVTIE